MPNLAPTRRWLWAIFALFLVLYSIYKYLFGAPQGFSWHYLGLVALLVGLTGVLPFLVPYFLLTKMRQRSGQAPWLTALFAPTVISMAGYALFYSIFIAPNLPDVDFWAVTLRGWQPGLVLGALLAAWLRAGGANGKPQP